jgi:GrpB-like predicted nucleotidyltransferase (UPF0157 family)
MVGVEEENQLNTVAEALTQPSYVYLQLYDQQLPFRRFFIGMKPPFSGLHPYILTQDHFIEIPHNQRKSHIHVVPVQSQWWDDHLLFRDFLNDSIDDLREYEKVKMELSKREWKSGNEYAAAKTSCIQDILKKAKNMK